MFCKFRHGRNLSLPNAGIRAAYKLIPFLPGHAQPNEAVWGSYCRVRISRCAVLQPQDYQRK